MLPEDFAASAPWAFSLPDEWAAIEGRYATLGPSDSLQWVFDHVRRAHADRALLEHEYLDGDYRTEYSNFYVKAFRRLPDRCERLHFWAGSRYLGFCSIRPIQGHPVCRTMLDPGADYETAVSCAVIEEAHPYGERLAVPGFPFISQDGQYARCAHAVIWMVAKYHHLQNRMPLRTISDVVDAAAAHESERVIPSRGLTDQQIGAALRGLDLGAVQYRLLPERGQPADLPDADAVEALVLRYLNSGIPLLLGTSGHLTALIGARRDGRDGPLQVVRCDDESGAYGDASMVLGIKRGLRRPRGDAVWERIFVPLPGRIFLLGEDLQPTVGRWFARLLQHPFADPRVLHEPSIRTREYVVDSREYKRRLADRGVPAEFVVRHRQIAAPRWIWVAEIQDADAAAAGEPSVLAELAVDATSGQDRPQALWANVPGLHAAWQSDGAGPFMTRVEADAAPYETGTLLGL